MYVDVRNELRQLRNDVAALQEMLDEHRVHGPSAAKAARILDQADEIKRVAGKLADACEREEAGSR